MDVLVVLNKTLRVLSERFVEDQAKLIVFQGDRFQLEHQRTVIPAVRLSFLILKALEVIFNLTIRVAAIPAHEITIITLNLLSNFLALTTLFLAIARAIILLLNDKIYVKF